MDEFTLYMHVADFKVGVNILYPYIKLFKSIFFIATVIFLLACSSDDEPFVDVTLCEEGKAYNEASADESLKLVISEFIAEHDISCFDETTITEQAVSSAFYVIEYGELKDCESGCYSSVLCAINDVNGPALYSAVWTAEDEMPQALVGICESDPMGGEGNTHQNCQVTPSGFLHPISYSNEFQNLIYSDDSLFRRCR